MHTIDADKVLEEIEILLRSVAQYEDEVAKNVAEELLINLKDTIQNMQNSDSHWTRDDINPYTYVCARCHTQRFGAYSYCPDCGAKMI